MSENLMRAQDIFLGSVNQICNKFGLNNIMAQLYALLYLAGRPLSLNDMIERLKISKGSVSVNIRALERYGAVRRVWVKGSRRDYYEAESDIYKVITERVKSMAHRRISEVGDMLSSSYQALNSVNPHDEKERDSINIFKQRLESLGRLHAQAQSIFNLFNDGLLTKMLTNNLSVNKDEKNI